MSQSPLRILHILDHSLPVHSGYAFRSQAILRTQKKRGWDPSVVTSPKHYESWQQSWSPSEEVGGIQYHRAVGVAQASLPLEKERRIMVTLAARMREIVRQQSIQVLHAHSPVLNAIPALWVGRKTGIPVVYEVRAPWEDAAIDHGTYGSRSWRYKLVKALETWVCKKVHHVAVLCQGLREEMVRRAIAPQKLTVIPNGVDVDSFQKCDPDSDLAVRWGLTGKRVVAFLGSFFRYEGLDLLIEAIALIVRQDPRVVLLLVGGGIAEFDLKAQVRRLQLDSHVIMPGSVAPERIPGVYALVDVLAYPRHSLRLTELVTPLKPLEAMAMGKALVASNIGGHRELIRDGQTGLLFPAGNAEALASAIQRLLGDAELRCRLEQTGDYWVRHERSWEKTTADYSEVYTQAFQRQQKREGRFSAFSNHSLDG